MLPGSGVYIYFVRNPEHTPCGESPLRSSRFLVTRAVPVEVKYCGCKYSLSGYMKCIYIHCICICVWFDVCTWKQWNEQIEIYLLQSEINGRLIWALELVYFNLVVYGGIVRAYERKCNLMSVPTIILSNWVFNWVGSCGCMIFWMDICTSDMHSNYPKNQDIF